MREALKPYFGNTLKFKGKIEAFQRDKLKRRSSHFAVIRLTDVTILEQTATIHKTPTHIAEQVIADHIWIESGKWAKQLNTGDTVVFTARVSSYSKQNRRGDIVQTDFGLFKPKYIHHQKGKKNAKATQANTSGTTDTMQCDKQRH